MPQIDGSQASPATNTLRRRIAAAAIDLTFVAVPAVLLALLSSERFKITEFNDDRARFDVADQLRINEIDAGPNRAMQLGDTVYTLSGTGLLLTITLLAILTITVFFVIPAMRGGQTPGRSVLRLPIRTEEKTDVELLSVSVASSAAVTSELAIKTETAESSTGTPTVEEFPGPVDHITEPDQLFAPPTTDREIKDETVPETPVQEAPVQEQTPIEQLGQDDLNIDGLREALQADLKDRASQQQVTLGNDDDYAEWSELDGLNLTDRPEDKIGQADSFDTLTLPESSLSETPLTATIAHSGGRSSSKSHRGSTVTVERELEAQIEIETEPESDVVAGAGDPGEISPEWSKDWQSWVYYDEATNRWFRHDQDTDRWLPIS